jgi:hypothetical protein
MAFVSLARRVVTIQCSLVGHGGIVMNASTIKNDILMLILLKSAKDDLALTMYFVFLGDEGPN